MTRDDWLRSHEYLRPVARFVTEVESALARIEIETAEIPCLESCVDELGAGVPLLASRVATVDLEPAGRAACALVAELSASKLELEQVSRARALHSELARDSAAAHRVVDALMGESALAPEHTGMLRFLGWTAATRCLRPLVRALESRCQDESWMRSYCPTCGSAPAMSQLIGADPGRLRFLACGACGTRWRFARTACPFCDHDAQRLAVVAIEGEAHLRIDACDACRGYLKSYVGNGEEALYLADWTSLHLDLIAQDRGLKRAAASLYTLDLAPPA
jgi:FdhE protein